MLSEVKAEVMELIGNRTFSRNLSCTLILAIVTLFTLADLQGRKTEVAEQASIFSISRPNTLKIIMKLY